MDVEHIIGLIVIIYWSIVGTVFGSFLGVVIDRLPHGKSIIWGRSHCDTCKRSLRWFELIPIFSFVIQRGRCLMCRSKLSWRYPVYELVTGILFAGLWYLVGPSLLLFFSTVIICCSLFVIFVIDLDHMIIPDVLIVTTSIGALSYHLLYNQSIIQFIQNNIVTGVISYILFYLLWAGTKRKGIGFGDVK